MVVIVATRCRRRRLTRGRIWLDVCRDSKAQLVPRSTDDPWGAPINLGSNVNTSFLENVKSSSRYGHWMFFNSDHPAGLGGAGGLNNLDIWVAWRAHPTNDFSWEPAEPLGAVVNSTFFDAGAWFLHVRNGPPVLFFCSERPGGLGSADIYVTEITSALPGHSYGRAGGLAFSPPVLVPELSSAQNDARPAVRWDGLEVILQSDRNGSLGSNDLWGTSRGSLDEAWSLPANLGSVVIARPTTCRHTCRGIGVSCSSRGSAWGFRQS